MGAQVLLIPAFFAAICATFIIVQSCYTKWKLNSKWKRKRSAAKVSLVNILQVTNSHFNLRRQKDENLSSKSQPDDSVPSIVVGNVATCTCKCKKQQETDDALKEPPPPYSHETSLPPPGYEDLYGRNEPGAVICFSPEDELPSFNESQSQRDVASNNTRAVAVQASDKLEQQPPGESYLPTERRNSSAVLYL